MEVEVTSLDRVIPNTRDESEESMSESRILIGIVTAVLILGACSNGVGTDERSSASTSASSTTSATTSPTTSTTTQIERGLDLSGRGG